MSRSSQQARRLQRRAKRDAERERRLDRLPPGEVRDESRVVRLLSYDITLEALPEPSHGGTHLETILDDEWRQELFDQVHHDPAAAIVRLRELVERFPDCPILYNWLSVAYLGVKDDAAADATAQLLYERHPQYLFGRLHLAERALRAGDIARFEAILERKFDLKLLYPWRDVFHLSEFLSFSATMIEYYIRTAHDDAAEKLHEVMNQMAPDASQTRAAGKMLEHVGALRLVKEALERMADPAKGRRKSGKGKRPHPLTPPESESPSHISWGCP